MEDGRVRASFLRLAPVRALRRSPGLNALIVATLVFGLAVWLTTHAMAASFERDPARHTERLWRVELVRYPQIREILAGTDMEFVSELPSLVLSPGEVEDLSRSPIPAGSAAVTMGEVPIVDPSLGRARIAWARFVGRDAFALFTVRLAAGGVFEDGKRELLVSERDAQRWFGGSPAAVGRTLRVCGEDWNIAGVVAADAGVGRRLHLRDESGDDVLWMPFQDAVRLGVLPFQRHPAPRSTRATNDDFDFASLWVELPDAASVGKFREWLGQWSAAHPRAGVPRIRSYQEWAGAVGTPPAYRVVELFGAATLAACCLTLVRLFHTRNRLHERDIALRRAVGASRRSLLGEALVEAGVIVGVAALGGVVLAAVALDVLDRTMPSQIVSFTMSGSSAIAGAAIGVAVGIVAALLPAWRACAQQPARALRAAA
jgi:putative ABC transport system permease protein